MYHQKKASSKKKEEKKVKDTQRFLFSVKQMMILDSHCCGYK